VEERWHAGEGRVNLSELCRELGISRETAYVWLRRYRESGHDVQALVERSHPAGAGAGDVGGLVVPATRPFAAATGPNVVGCVDF
jgi:sirohydrochlorin ferrochelatase